ncbi:MAG: 50S ribosomal protein L21 [bacterium]|nr:50S ribosomal protein L21 [bacterium]
MFAVIETGGKQYRVSPKDKIKVEKLDVEKAEFTFDKVLMIVDGDKMDIGDPYLKGAKVSAKVLEQGRAKKLIVFKYKSKTRQRTKRGHRQPYTEVEITKIGA